MITPTPNAVATKPDIAPRATWETNGHYVAITLTDALREAIEARAKADDTTPGLLARSIVAEFLGVTVDVTRSAPRKYANEQDKKTAQTQRRLFETAFRHMLFVDHLIRIGNTSKAADTQKLMDAALAKIPAGLTDDRDPRLVGTKRDATVGGSFDALEADLMADESNEIELNLMALADAREAA